MKRYYMHIFSFILVLASLFIVYYNDLQILLDEMLSNKAFTHILLTPILTTFLFYTRRDLVKASIALEKPHNKYGIRIIDDLVGVILCLAAFLIYWYGSKTFYSLEYHILSLPILAIGITLITLGFKALRILLFPILFLLFLTPPPMEILYSTAGILANIETQIAYLLLKSLSLPVELSTEYGPPTIQLLSSLAGDPAGFTIDLPCSGIYTLIGLLMFSFYLALIAKASVPRRISIFAIGLPILETLNIIRITTIVSIAYQLGGEIAIGVFHLLSGPTLTFIGSLLTLTLSEKLFKTKIFHKPEKNLCPECEGNHKKKEAFCPNCGRFLNLNHKVISNKTLAKTILLLLGCSLAALTISAPTLAIAQNSIKLESITSWSNSTSLFPEKIGYTLRFLYRDENYERIAGQDVALVYAYLPTNNTKPAIFATINVANSLSNLHSWEVCLITLQTAHGRYPIVDVLDSRDIQLSDDLPIVARYLVFKSPRNYTQITLYWFEKANFDTGITVEQKYVRINLIILTSGKIFNYRLFEDELLEIGRTIAYHWKTITTQSLVSLGIPTIQISLAICTFLVIFLKTSQYVYESRIRARNMRIFRSFASKEDKILLEAIQKVSEKNGIIELQKLKEILKQKGRFVNNSDLKERLDRLEKYGFIKGDIILIEDAPRLVWRTRLFGKI